MYPDDYIISCLKIFTTDISKYLTVVKSLHSIKMQKVAISLQSKKEGFLVITGINLPWDEFE